jgi:hypothetical protein
MATQNHDTGPITLINRFFVLPYLDVDMGSSGDDFARSAVSHPVFLVQPR